MIPLKFFEYSNSKWYTCKPDIVEYEKDADQPVFDLIIGCKSMKEWGIVLDFCKKTITIDGIILPMRNINSLTKSKIKTAWALNNSLAHEPQSTAKAMQWCIVRILDAKY